VKWKAEAYRAAAAAVQAERVEARNACCPYRQTLGAISLQHIYKHLENENI